MTVNIRMTNYNNWKKHHVCGWKALTCTFCWHVNSITLLSFHHIVKKKKKRSTGRSTNMLTGHFYETIRQHKQMVQQGFISGETPPSLQTCLFGIRPYIPTMEAKHKRTLWYVGHIIEQVSNIKLKWDKICLDWIWVTTTLPVVF